MRNSNYLTSNMEEVFFSSLLQILVAQILKSSGFDKCRPSTLSTVTDLYKKHLELVINSAKKFALARSGTTADVSPNDLIQALYDVHLLKLDPGPLTKSLESFHNWLRYSDTFTISKKLSEVPTSQIKNLVEKRKVDMSTETAQERKKRRLKERQEYYNHLKQGEDSLSGLVEDFEEDEFTSEDKLSWLEYLAEKDLKLGHTHKFINSCMEDALVSVHKNNNFHPPLKDGQNGHELLEEFSRNSRKSDHIVLGPNDDEAFNIPTRALPYNVTYDKAILDDVLQQYNTVSAKSSDEAADSPKSSHEEILDQPGEEVTPALDLALNDPRQEDQEKEEPFEEGDESKKGLDEQEEQDENIRRKEGSGAVKSAETEKKEEAAEAKNEKTLLDDDKEPTSLLKHKQGEPDATKAGSDAKNADVAREKTPEEIGADDLAVVIALQEINKDLPSDEVEQEASEVFAQSERALEAHPEISDKEDSLLDEISEDEDEEEEVVDDDSEDKDYQ